MPIPLSFANDHWSDWLQYGRFGGSAERQAAVRIEVAGFIDRLLDTAHLTADETIVDVGSGEGDVAFRAIERAGPSINAILVDISEVLLKRAESVALELGVSSQCKFVANSADKLIDLQDECADVVATRASLAYVGDKPAALKEFLRVLKPGGRLTMAEPILQDEALELIALNDWLELHERTAPLHILSLLLRWRSAQFPGTRAEAASNPLTNFSERDLASLLHDCGYAGIHMELHIDVLPAASISWDTYLCMSPHPWSPTVGSVLRDMFDGVERKTLEGVLRPLVEAGRGHTTRRIAYLSARKPPTQVSQAASETLK